MRCDQCNKFASYDDSTDPEVDVDFNSETGELTANTRIVLTHDECGTELKEATFDFEASVPQDVLDAHKGDSHDLDAEDSGELTSRTEGKGRYLKTFYGASVTIVVSCSCQAEALWETTLEDDLQASYMDELV